MADLAAGAAGCEPSELADHATDCCLIARRWLEGLDASLHRGRARETPPAWIARRFGPDAAPGPVHWCEVVRAERLAGGAAAALGRELWGRRCGGVRAVGLLAAGLDGERAYREAIGRERSGRLEIWDPLAGAWLPPGPGGEIVGLRVAGPPAGPLAWGEHRLSVGAWTVVADGESGRAGQVPNAAFAAPAPAPARSQNP